MKIKKYLSIIFICILTFTGCNAMNKKNTPIVLNLYSGKTISFYDDNINNYFNLKGKDNQATFLKTHQSETFNSDIKHEITWEKGQAPYNIIFSTDIKFTSEFLKFTTNEKSISLYSNDYFTYGAYYYKVIDSNGLESKTDCFIVNDRFKIINCEQVFNIRDLGGLKTRDNKTIKYGMLFRGGKLENATDSDKEYLLSLGLKTDLDLRGAAADDDGLKKNGPSPIGLENYYLTKINTYDDIIKYHDYQATKYKATFDVLCDETKYPIYFHCTWGADRTGMIAFLVEAVLGVRLEDIYKDYEFTSFSGKTGARWRSNIIGEDGNYSFDDTGVQRSDIRFGLTINKLLKDYGNNTNDIQVASKNYLLSIGITEDQINNLIQILTK